MNIQIHNLLSLNATQREKIVTAMKKGIILIDLPVWEQKVLSATFTETRGMTNAQIRDLIRSGADGKGKVADGDIDIDIRGYYSYRRVIGYTFLNDYRQWVNRRFLDRMAEHDLFGHIMHETLHRFGFAHTSTHASSVPYRIGNICRLAYLEHYSGKEFELESVDFLDLSVNRQ